MTARITHPDDPALDELAELLRRRGAALDQPGAWPAEQLALCGEYGVFEWFVGPPWGGQGWSEADVMRGYLKLSAACLTTTFVITQRTGACRRIEGSANHQVQQQFLPGLVRGDCFATVAVSHLTTSRRHLRKPILRAEPQGEGFVLNGYSPWVTGAAHADVVVVGAALEDGRQILAAVPMHLPGIQVPPPAELVGLSASCTGPIQFDDVVLDRCWLLAGPVENVMQSGEGAGTGGLQTSALALGVARAATDFLADEALRREDLRRPLEPLREECDLLSRQLLQLAAGQPACSTELLRTRANSLVLRAAQAALAAAKGSGYVVGHPAGRWCREALFFLVWSCPQPVMAANLCELAGISD